MKIIRAVVLTVLAASTQMSWAGDLTTDSAIGGAIGGALGAVLGAQMGGRDGAILGAGVGGLAGVAISTDGDRGRERGRYYDDRHYRDDGGGYYPDRDRDRDRDRGYSRGYSRETVYYEDRGDHWSHHRHEHYRRCDD